jgi:putative peptidoglycan lipid II flippase
MAPATLGVSVSQVSLLINTIFASYLASGSVSWLYYADRLMEFPAGMLGAALGVILLPSLSRCHANADAREYSALLDWGLRLTLLLALPAAVGLALLAAPLIVALFFHGAFSAHDVLATRQALVAYSLGLTGMILVKVLAPGFYARQNIRTPVKIALASLGATQLMNLLFIFGLSLAHAGLALSIGLAACLNAFLLYRGLRRRQVYTPQPGWRGFMLKLACALALMASVLYLGVGESQDWLNYPLMTRLWRLGALVITGMVVYFVTLWVLGFRLSDFRRRSTT